MANPGMTAGVPGSIVDSMTSSPIVVLRADDTAKARGIRKGLGPSCGSIGPSGEDEFPDLQLTKLTGSSISSASTGLMRVQCPGNPFTTLPAPMPFDANHPCRISIA